MIIGTEFIERIWRGKYSEKMLVGAGALSVPKGLNNYQSLFAVLGGLFHPSIKTVLAAMEIQPRTKVMHAFSTNRINRMKFQ